MILTGIAQDESRNDTEKARIVKINCHCLPTRFGAFGSFYKLFSPQNPIPTSFWYFMTQSLVTQSNPTFNHSAADANMSFTRKLLDKSHSSNVSAVIARNSSINLSCELSLSTCVLKREIFRWTHTKTFAISHIADGWKKLNYVCSWRILFSKSAKLFFPSLRRNFINLFPSENFRWKSIFRSKESLCTHEGRKNQFPFLYFIGFMHQASSKNNRSLTIFNFTGIFRTGLQMS